MFRLVPPFANSPMPSSRLGSLVAAVAFAVLPIAGEAQITSITAPSPAPSSSLSARLRWGGTGWEAGTFAGPTQTGLLNATGTPVWQLKTPYNFRVIFDHLTGSLGLDVDFDADGVFEPLGGSNTLGPEGISVGTTFANQGFGYVSIGGNGNNQSTLSNLMINGTSFPDITPTGSFTESWFANAAPASVTVTGTLTFTAAATANEEPAWNIYFRGPQAAVSVVPEPSSLALLGLGVAGLWAVRRRRSA